MYIAITVIWLLLLFGSLQQLSSAVSNSFYENKKVIADLKSTPDGQLFYVEVAVGPEQSRQTFNLLVSTTYFMTWIASLELNPTRGYKRIAAGHRPKVPGCFGGYKYDICEDTVQIAGHIQLKHQSFAVTYPAKSDVYFPFHLGLHGMLGLSDDTLPRSVDYIFDRLHYKRYATKRMFSLYINNSALLIDEASNQSGVKGALVMGGVEERYYEGNITYVGWPQTDLNNFGSIHNNKSLEIIRVQLDWSGRNRERPLALPLAPSLIDDGNLIDLFAQKSRLLLDSSAILYVGPRKILDHIHVDFLGATKLSSSGKMYAFADCHLDNKPNLVFSLQGLDFIVTPADYVIEHQIDGRKLCLSAFMALDDKPIWVFGTKFLRKYYTVFDYPNSRIGFATPTT